MCDVISADSHLDFWYLPGDLFYENARESMRERMPRVKDSGNGMAWMYEGRVLRYVGDVGQARSNERSDRAVRSIRVERKANTGIYADAMHGVFRPGTPELRGKDLDLDGVGGDVIYGIFGLSHRIAEADVVAEVFRVYNDYIFEFRKYDPGRYAPLACLPYQDAQQCAAELERTAKIGFTGAELIISATEKPVWDRSWDAVWAVAEEAGVPISFHNQGLDVRPVDPGDPNLEENAKARNAVKQSVTRLGSAEFLASIIYSGALDRYPGFKFVLGEASIGWLPYFLQRMDYEYDEEEKFRMDLKLRPSEYFRRNAFATYERDAVGTRLIDLIGEDNVMWGSDYPHPDGTWPESQAFIAAETAHLSEATRRKVLHDNAAKLFKLN